MSRIENIITTTFRAAGGNVISTVGQMGGSMRNFGRIINDNTRMSERLNAQWRAFGTTLRYALAGNVIFGASRLLSQIKDINQQLGQMQALSGIGGTAFSNQQVNSLGNALQKTALDTITPLSQVNDAAVNFLSTVQDVKPSQLPDMLSQIGIGAKLAQTPIEDLTQAATTFQIAFGRMVDPTSIGQFTRMWTQLIGVAPGGIAAAPTIAQSIPGLASMFQLAPGRETNPATSQAQLMSLTLGVLRTGMPPATAMRGLTYLLQSIAQPTGGAKKALAGIGITSQSVAQGGIYANTMKLLQTISARPGEAKRLAAIPDDTLDQIDSSGGNLPGIPASEMSRLRQMIPRIHGIRAAIILASQLQQHGDVQSLGGDLTMMLQAQNENSDTTKALQKAWQNLNSRSRLQEAANAVNLMSVQIAQTFNPLFDFVSSGIALHAAPWMQTHRKAVKDIAIGGTAVVGALTVGRALGLGNLPGLRSVPGLRGLMGGRGLVAENAIRAAATGGLGLGASPQNPLYVVVVGQLFGGAVVADPNAPTSGGGSGKSLPGWMKVVGAGLATKYGSSVLSGALKYAKGAPGFLMAETPAFGDFFKSVASGKDVTTGENVGFWRSLLGTGDFSNAQDYAVALHRAQKLYPGTTAIDSFHKTNIQGRAEIAMTIDMTDSNGKKVVKRVHVPVDMWSGGRIPRTSGKAGKGNRG